jgi:hypothetical protein
MAFLQHRTGLSQALTPPAVFDVIVSLEPEAIGVLLNRWEMLVKEMD